jgi:heme-degrading monooxygenase HmoA
MIIASFIFEPGKYDEEFHRLNAIIDSVAKSLPGFLGTESWQSEDGRRRNASYFWDSLETLKTFSIHPSHLEAKRQYRKWYEGYHIVISEVVRSYGDGAFAHFTPNDRSRSP